MDILELDIPGVVVLTPKRHRDDRGFLSETYSAAVVREATGAEVFAQDNHSYSARKGTIRGLHYQAPPHAQGKLVRCARGAVRDVVVDARRGSPTYGRHVSYDLTAENWAQIWAPEGCLHGFATLTDDVDVLYKVTRGYDRASEGAIHWADESLAIDWGVAPDEAIVSDKDKSAPAFADFVSPFSYSAS
ncbi:MAG: dTDP-4-dehydrorhamnose 3,5-epimerase [Pseudomonadota bacterium]